MSAAVGIGIALALARGITYRLQAGAAKNLGNFWVDLVRATVYILLPISIPVALLLVSQGVVQNFSSYVEITTLEGAKQTIAMGPVASQEIIKELGTNGGGFFNANSAHPFESATPLTNLIEMLLIFCIPAALTYTYGRMQRHLLDDEQRARDLGAEVVRMRSEKPVNALLEFARDHDGRPSLIDLAVKSFRFLQVGLENSF